MIRIENATKELMEGLINFFKQYPSDVKAEEVFNGLYDITISNEVPVIISHNLRSSDIITLDLGCHFFVIPKSDMYRFSII